MKTRTKPQKNGHQAITTQIKTDYLKKAGKISDATKEAKTSAQQTMKDVQAYCQDNPGKAMSFAAGVAAVASLALVQAFSQKRSKTEKVLSEFFRKGETAWKHVQGQAKPVIQKVKKSVEAGV